MSGLPYNVNTLCLAAIHPALVCLKHDDDSVKDGDGGGGSGGGGGGDDSW